MREDITSKSEASKTVVDLNELATEYDAIINRLESIFEAQKDAWKSSSSEAFVASVQNVLDEGRIIRNDVQVVCAAANKYIGEMHNIDTGVNTGSGSSAF